MPTDKLFISHSSADAELANALQKLITEGTSLSNEQVFNSSRDVSAPPTGVEFVPYMRKALSGTNFIIHLITPAYLGSDFCKWEFGASWVRNIPSFPMRTSKVTNAELPEILRQVQVAEFTKTGLNELLEKMKASMSISAPYNGWDRARDTFTRARPGILRKVEARYASLPHEKLARDARFATGMPDIHQAFHLLRDIASDRLLTKEPPPTEPQLDIKHLVRGLRDSLDHVSAVFSDITGATCRLCIKRIILPTPKNEVLLVTDLVRTRHCGERRRPPKPDRVDENTDFEDIIHGGGDYFFCNDLDARRQAGLYRNSHPDYKYRSTIVWPIRKQIENASLVPKWYKDYVQETQDIVGFLCVDSVKKNIFTGCGMNPDSPGVCIETPREDVALGAAYADTLYPVIQPYFGSFGALFGDETDTDDLRGNSGKGSRAVALKKREEK